MTTTDEILVNLNSSELGILISALKCIERSDEYVIEKEYGSLSTLHNRLRDLSVGMDLKPLPLICDVDPSF